VNVGGSIQTDELIGRLTADAAPVRRLRPPTVRAVLWLAVALAVLAAIVAYHGVRPDLQVALAEPGAWLSLLAAVTTGIAATLAAFHLVVPGTSDRWAFLPLPVALVWGSGLGIGCYADWIRSGPEGIHAGDSLDCFLAILWMSLAAGVPLVVMLRVARFVRPVATAAMGGLAVASLASAALELFHRTDARIMDVVWHTAAVTLIVVFASGSAAAARRGALDR
jgi:hypothetical protein